MADRIAAVTGGTGFLGQALVEALASAGWRVRALVRRPPPEGCWGSASVERVPGDLSDGRALRRLTEGAGLVVHAAGLVKARRDDDFLDINANGARAVAQAFADQSGRFLLISSLAAREPGLSAYARSKRQGEEAVRELIDATRLTVIRPPAIYGPGDREMLALFQAAAHSPILPRLGAADARVALAHVTDVAAEIVRLAHRAGPVAMTTLGGDKPEGYSWDEILNAAAEALGRRPIILPCPAPALRLAGAACDLLTRLDGRPRMLTSGKARELRHTDWSVRPEELGPERRPAAFTLAEGFADAVMWYRRHGWLPAATQRPLEPAKASL